MADEIPNNDSIFKKIGSVISTTLDVVKSELQSEIDNGFSNNIISGITISGSTTITNGNRNISISFSSESLLSNGTIVSFEIDFNDSSEIQTIQAVNNSGTANHIFTSDGIVGTTKDIFVKAIDDVGNKSKLNYYTLTYRDNAVPSGIIVPSFNAVFYEGATSVTFSGATDSDGTIVSYKVSNISLSGITVSNAIVNAGQPHIFNVATGIVIPGNSDISFTYMVSAIDNNGDEGASTLINSSTGFVVISGESVFTTPGTYNWICPSGVKYVSIVCIGAGGGGGAGYWAGGGGGGGGLGWKNSISVTPGTSYSVVIGTGGISYTASQCANGQAGGNSYFGSTSTVCGFGGAGGSWGVADAYSAFPGGNGGSYAGDGGGIGGTGGTSQGDTAAGGAGAAGYTGSGGNGGMANSSTQPTSGSGGGAGGGGFGGSNSSAGAAPSGGGTGIFGQGTNGAATSNAAGLGGSGGTAGSGNLTSGGSSNTGGSYGGGGGGQSNDSKSTPGCHGGHGAVRIIWGLNRSFPYNAS